MEKEKKKKRKKKSYQTHELLLNAIDLKRDNSCSSTAKLASFALTMEKQPPPSLSPAEQAQQIPPYYPEWLNQLDTGDIILFNRRCLSMNAFGALLCVSAKWFGQTVWDHIAVVVKRNDQVFVC